MHGKKKKIYVRK